MTVLRVAGGRVLTPTGWGDGDVVIEEGLVASVGGRGGAGRVLDASGLLVIPGFVDLQVNGGFGYDFTSRPESVWEAGAKLPRTGVTSFLPTLVSCPSSVVGRAMEVLAAGPPTGYVGAVPLGLHLEGPMLEPPRRGAHDLRYLKAPSLEVIGGWSRDRGVRLVTLAPELPGADEVVGELTGRGVTVSAGHSDANFEEALWSFTRGVTCGTHLFNAMPPFRHREPGLVGALLASEVPAGLIVDGLHVHAGGVAVAWRAKGPGDIALVTDATAAMGAGPGTFHLGSTPLLSDGAEARRPDGGLAGSVIGLDEAVRNVVEFTGCRPEDAIAAASSTPARMVSEKARGRIEEGARADLVLLDADLFVVATVVEGVLAFDRRADEAVAGAGP